MINKNSFKLILLSLVSVYSFGVQARMMKFDEPTSSSFIITLPADSSLQSLSDDELWEKAAMVKFPVGSAYIPYSDPGFCKVVKAVENLKANNYDVSRLLVIRGSASPEGGEKNNARLAHQRAKALVKVLSKYIPLPDSLVEERYIKEDYVGLRRLMEEKPTAYSQQVLSILKKYKDQDAQVKQALQRLNGGKTWRLLLRDYFPELRASRLVLFVSKKGSTPQSDSTPLVDNTSTPLGVPADLQSAGKQAVTNEQASVDTIAADTLLTADCKSAAPPKGQDGLQVEARPSAHPGLNIKTNLLYDLALFVPKFGYALTPNLAIEYLPKSGHITPVLEVTWSPWRNDSRSKTWIIHNFLLEGRYYIRKVKSEERRVKNSNAYTSPLGVPADLQSAGKERASGYTGHYFSAYTNLGTYDLQFNSTKAYLADKWGKTYGFGLGWGYVKRFTESSRWKWEVNAALGFLHSDYDKYHDAESWAEPGNTYFNWHENPADYRRYKNHLNYWGVTRLGFSISYDLF